MPSPGLAATWGADQFATFVLDHLAQESVVFASGARRINITGKTAHVPRLNSDGTAAWTAENAEIASSAPDADEIVLAPKKLADVVTISNESIDDAEVEVLDQVGLALTRAVGTALDTAVFDATAASAVRPAGLRSAAYTLPGAAATAIGDAASVDLLLDGIGAIRNAGGRANAIYMNAGDLTELTKLKEASGSNRPLLQPDVTQEGRYTLGGATLWPVPGFPAEAAIVADASQLVVGVRKDIAVEFSSDAKFTADGVAARVTARFDWEPNDTDGFYSLT